MNIVVAGGSGFIGRPLYRALVDGGHHVIVLSRNPRQSASRLDPRITTIAWDGVTCGAWEKALEGTDAILNLAGEPIADKRWTGDRKKVLRESRFGTTRLLIKAISRLATRSRTLINASGVGYYGPGDSTRVTEHAPAGSGFLADLSLSGEREALQAERYDVRVVRLRIGIVLGKDGGALSRMALPYRFFLGGPISPGDQWISWIHHQDLIGLIQWILAGQTISGPVNAVAPGATTMRDFSRILGQVLDRPSWLLVPKFALYLALGELATVLTTGQHVQPTVALQGGYVFHYPSLEPALREILTTDSPA